MRRSGNNIRISVNNLIVSYSDHGAENAPAILNAGHVSNLENSIDFNCQLVKFVVLVSKKHFA